MAEEKKGSTPAPGTAATKKEKSYEVVHSVALGIAGKVVTRHRGEEVTASELGESSVEDLLAKGIIVDPEAPGALASGEAVFDRLFSIALRVGAATRNGAEIQFGPKKVRGIAELRQLASVDELEAGIVAAFERAKADKAKAEARANELATSAAAASSKKE